MAKSHALMLQDIQEKHPEIANIIYQLSKSSFYMYLARQSSQFGSHRLTLFWLYQALKADFITPPCRYGFYTLSIKSILGLIAEQTLSQNSSKENAFARFKRWLGANNQVITIADLEKRKLSLKFKLLLGSLLHRSIDSMI
jgi:hypothetical protein